MVSIALKTESKPLYLDGSKPCCVHLDGPALRIDAQGKSPVRVPLKRLSRVISDYRVQWMPEAIYRCLQNGLAISICAANGDAVGMCLPVKSERTLLAQELEIFRTYSDWINRYEIWRMAAERRAVLQANKVMKLGLKELNTSKAEKALDYKFRKIVPVETLEGISERIRGFVSGLVAETLHQRGVTPSILRYPTRNINLYGDLVVIASWDGTTVVHSAYLEALRKNIKATPDFIASVFERNSDFIRERVDYYINLLEEVVIEVNHDRSW